MALKDTIAAALREPIAMLTREFGMRVRLRRPEYTEAADGSTDMELVAVPGVSDTTLRVIVTSANIEALLQEWGRESKAILAVLATDAVPWQVDDVLYFREGAHRGRYLEVVGVRATEPGGIVEMALREPGMDMTTLDKGF